MRRDRDDESLNGPGIVVLILVLLAVFVLVFLDHSTR
jgi:hypothetical protein